MGCSGSSHARASNSSGEASQGREANHVWAANGTAQASVIVTNFAGKTVAEATAVYNTLVSEIQAQVAAFTGVSQANLQLFLSGDVNVLDPKRKLGEVVARPGEGQLQMMCMCRARPTCNIAFPDYARIGSVVQDNSVFLGSGDFSITMLVRPDVAAYGMLASFDRACVADHQFRLEFYKSRCVGWTVAGLLSGNRPYGDHNRYAADLCSDPLTLGERVRITIVRNKCAFYLYIGGQNVGSAEGRNNEVTSRTGGRAFRIGSRFPRGGESAQDPFKGEITGAEFFDRPLEPLEVESFEDR